MAPILHHQQFVSLNPHCITGLQWNKLLCNKSLPPKTLNPTGSPYPSLQSLGRHVPSDLAPQLTAGSAAFAIWTTTPWTIPANLAVAVNDKLEYALVEVQVGGHGVGACLRQPVLFFLQLSLLLLVSSVLKLFVVQFIVKLLLVVVIPTTHAASS